MDIKKDILFTEEMKEIVWIAYHKWGRPWLKSMVEDSETPVDDAVFTWFDQFMSNSIGPKEVVPEED